MRPTDGRPVRSHASENSWKEKINAHPRAAHWKVAALALLFTGSVACPAASPHPSGEGFATPEAAAGALAQAWQDQSSKELLAVLGPGGRRLVLSGDEVAEKHAWSRLASAYSEDHRIEIADESVAVIILGKEGWPYPIPLVKSGTVWHFDVAKGAEQIIDRRIGRNELKAIEICRTIVQAEREFAASSKSIEGTERFADRLASTPGQRNGLYWSAASGEAPSPLGPFVASAEVQGYRVGAQRDLRPFHGYYFRILTRQGTHAPGGARSYWEHGHLSGGFALVAFPATYGDSGVKTFIVNNLGVVFEKNLGPKTAAIARQMNAFDPDASWSVARGAAPESEP